MKLVYCSYEDCGLRRKHWAEPFTPRGQRVIEVNKNYKGPMFCSFECAMMAGVMCYDARKIPRVDIHTLPDAKEVSWFFYLKRQLKHNWYKVKNLL